jgi:2-C-methyl-D-erythritol 4-phosphate cytidylyltransferase/2-C-methyl-D-erythritol 2,4-cyclodiphosphate synthase
LCRTMRDGTKPGASKIAHSKEIGANLLPTSGNRNPARTTIAAVIAAGGTGSRIGAELPKQFLHVGGRPILVRTIQSILALEGVVQVIIALPDEHIPLAEAMLACWSWTVPITCTAGGPTRQESVRRGVLLTPPDVDILLVHDAVRPFCDREMLERIVKAARRTGSAIPGLPATETIQRVSRRGRVLKTPPREELYAIQTPQCFHAAILRSALERAAREGFEGTDESSVVLWAGHPVTVVAGSPENIKITRPLDLEIAQSLFARDRAHDSGPRKTAGENAMLRIGHGIDYHRLLEGRKLVLGGVEIPYEKGLEGHSDADALVHAICDALLGAAALGDIGRHFPDSDPAHHGRPSLEFLREVREKVESAGWTVQNVDATLLAQRPKLAPFFDGMRRNVAQSLGLAPEAVSIKATTTEGMNAEGQGEGISAQAVALIRSNE